MAKFGQARLKRSSTPLVEPQYLKMLGSSDDLCEFYKDKILRLEERIEELRLLLDKIKLACRENNTVRSDLHTLATEVTNLQLAISERQVFLFKEREENLRLNAENDGLRIENFQLNKSLDVLLQLSGISYQQLMDIMSSNSEGKEEQESQKGTGRKTSSRISSVRANANKPETDHRDEPTRESLLLQIKSLKTQLENLKTLYRNEVDVLLKDREVLAGERATETRRLHHQISHLTSCLRQTEENLTETFNRLLTEQEDREGELERWKKERISLEKQFVLLSDTRDAYPSSSRGCSVKLLQTRITEQERLANVYHQQCKQLDVELKKWKEKAETAERLFKDKTLHMSADLAVMRNRYEELDRRRLLEAEGFRTDVRLLRERLKDLERKIEKIKLDEAIAAKTQPTEDLKYSTQQTLQRAKQFEKEVAALKTKFASIVKDGPSLS